LTVYADTSFFVSLYIKDSHSKTADQLLSSGSRPWFTPLHSAEWAHAVAQQVFWGAMSAADAQQVYRDFANDLAAGLWLEVELPENSFELCADLARRYGPKLGVRTLDSLHVACALQLKAERFWTFDDHHAKLAKAEGLKTSF
jgi:predicted nucleic acid-binding protein